MPDPTENPEVPARGTPARGRPRDVPAVLKSYVVTTLVGSELREEVVQGYRYRIRDGERDRVADGRLEIWREKKPTIWLRGFWVKLTQL